MGILDDAIKDHLDLKRRSGAGDTELQQLEDEAFGPPSRPGEDSAEGLGRPESATAVASEEDRPADTPPPQSGEGGSELDAGAQALAEPPKAVPESSPPSKPADPFGFHDFAAEEGLVKTDAPETQPEALREPPSEQADEPVPPPEPIEDVSSAPETEVVREQPVIDEPQQVPHEGTPPDEEGPPTEEAPPPEPPVAAPDRPEHATPPAEERPPIEQAPPPEQATPDDEVSLDEDLGDTQAHDMAAELGVEEADHARPPQEPAEDAEADDLELELEAEEIELEESPTPPEPEDQAPRTEVRPAVEEPPPPDAPPTDEPEGDDTEEAAGDDEGDGGDQKAAEGEDEGEDVLEETPEFLQDTPEHDQLWFEQRPPKDFDFEDD